MISLRLRNFVAKLAPLPVRSQLARRVLSASIWSLAGATGGKGLTLISSIIAARILGREGFGAFGVIQGTVGSFGIFAGLGLGLTATKYVAELRVIDPKRAGRIIALSQRIA